MTLPPLDGELYSDGITQWRCRRCLQLEARCVCGRPVDRPAASDALFDTSPGAMAQRFGQLAITRIRAGREPYEAARLAGSYGRQALMEAFVREGLGVDVDPWQVEEMCRRKDTTTADADQDPRAHVRRVCGGDPTASQARVTR